MRGKHVFPVGTFLATAASTLLAAVAGCSSNSTPPPQPCPTTMPAAAIPPSAIPPSATSIRGLEQLAAPSITAGSDASKASAVSEKTLTGGASARGFDFGDNGNGGGNGGPVTFDQLGQMLQSLGGHPQVQNGVYLFNVKDDSGGSYPLVISLSDDQRAIYFIVPLIPVDQAWANQDSLFKLLSANAVICPESFAVASQKLLLVMGVGNMNVAPDNLKVDLSYVFETVHKTRPLWGPWMQGGQGGGSPPSGGGGGTNPFQ
jgi:hypothetical protein